MQPAAHLRAAGLRVTARRVAILETLSSLGGHPTADEISSRMAAAGTAIPRASLYHALGAMADAGAIMLADAGPGTTRYEVGTSWHHHLVCRACGTVVDIPCAIGERPCLDPVIPGVVIDEAQVIFRGTCATCTARCTAGAIDQAANA